MDLNNAPSDSCLSPLKRPQRPTKRSDSKLPRCKSLPLIGTKRNDTLSKVNDSKCESVPYNCGGVETLKISSQLCQVASQCLTKEEQEVAGAVAREHSYSTPGTVMTFGGRLGSLVKSSEDGKLGSETMINQPHGNAETVTEEQHEKENMCSPSEQHTESPAGQKSHEILPTPCGESESVITIRSAEQKLQEARGSAELEDCWLSASFPPPSLSSFPTFLQGWSGSQTTPRWIPSRCSSLASIGELDRWLFHGEMTSPRFSSGGPQKAPATPLGLSPAIVDSEIAPSEAPFSSPPRLTTQATPVSQGLPMRSPKPISPRAAGMLYNSHLPCESGPGPSCSLASEPAFQPDRIPVADNKDENLVLPLEPLLTSTPKSPAQGAPFQRHSPPFSCPSSQSDFISSGDTSVEEATVRIPDTTCQSDSKWHWTEELEGLRPVEDSPKETGPKKSPPKLDNDATHGPQVSITERENKGNRKIVGTLALNVHSPSSATQSDLLPLPGQSLPMPPSHSVHPTGQGILQPICAFNASKNLTVQSKGTSPDTPQAGSQLIKKKYAPPSFLVKGSICSVKPQLFVRAEIPNISRNSPNDFSSRKFIPPSYPFSAMSRFDAKIHQDRAPVASLPICASSQVVDISVKKVQVANRQPRLLPPSGSVPSRVTYARVVHTKTTPGSTGTPLATITPPHTFPSSLIFKQTLLHAKPLSLTLGGTSVKSYSPAGAAPRRDTPLVPVPSPSPVFHDQASPATASSKDSPTAHPNPDTPGPMCESGKTHALLTTSSSCPQLLPVTQASITTAASLSRGHPVGDDPTPRVLHVYRTGDPALSHSFVASRSKVDALQGNTGVGRAFVPIKPMYSTGAAWPTNQP